MLRDIRTPIQSGLDSQFGPSRFSLSYALVGSRLEFLGWTHANVKLLLPPGKAGDLHNPLAGECACMRDTVRKSSWSSAQIWTWLLHGNPEVARHLGVWCDGGSVFRAMNEGGEDTREFAGEDCNVIRIDNTIYTGCIIRLLSRLLPSFAALRQLQRFRLRDRLIG